MSPAILRRIERRDGEHGWGTGMFNSFHDLHCWEMPGIDDDGGFPDSVIVAGNPGQFAWTGDSFERWVTASDLRRMAHHDYVLRTFFCPPGTFFIGHEQAVFDKQEAIMVAEEEL